jgi:hypothetical protein
MKGSLIYLSRQASLGNNNNKDYGFSNKLGLLLRHRKKIHYIMALKGNHRTCERCLSGNLLITGQGRDAFLAGRRMRSLSRKASLKTAPG